MAAFRIPPRPRCRRASMEVSGGEGVRCIELTRHLTASQGAYFFLVLWRFVVSQQLLTLLAVARPMWGGIVG